MGRPPKNGPRYVQLMRRERRTWATGETKHHFLLSVPNHIADQVDAGSAFMPVLLEDGSIMFKRWDPEAFNRWLVTDGEPVEE